MSTFTVTESLSTFIKDQIEQTDDNGSLYILSYKQCDNNSPDELKRCRGIVCDNDGNVVVRSTGYTPEWTCDNWIAFINASTTPMEYSFYPSMEGTLIRVFYHGEKWYFSTHRKLDAHRSRWGSSLSFGQLFEEALGTPLSTLTDRLDKEHVYLFLLSSNEHTRMVCQPAEKPSILHVGTLLNGTTYTTEYSIESINKPTRLNITSDQVCDYVEKMDPLTYQGIISFDEKGNQIKIINSKYSVYAQARGNEPSVMFRYLKVRGNPAYTQMLFDLYPDQKTNFVLYENLIYKIAKTIHTAYINRFVNKQQVVVSPEEYRIVKECHSFHIKDREHNKVTISQVLAVLAMPEYVSTLNALIKRLKIKND